MTSTTTERPLIDSLFEDFANQRRERHARGSRTFLKAQSQSGLSANRDCRTHVHKCITATARIGVLRQVVLPEETRRIAHVARYATRPPLAQQRVQQGPGKHYLLGHAARSRDRRHAARTGPSRSDPSPRATDSRTAPASGSLLRSLCQSCAPVVSVRRRGAGWWGARRAAARAGRGARVGRHRAGSGGLPASIPLNGARARVIQGAGRKLVRIQSPIRHGPGAFGEAVQRALKRERLDDVPTRWPDASLGMPRGATLAHALANDNVCRLCETRLVDAAPEQVFARIVRVGGDEGVRGGRSSGSRPSSSPAACGGDASTGARSGPRTSTCFGACSGASNRAFAPTSPAPCTCCGSRAGCGSWCSFGASG